MAKSGVSRLVLGIVGGALATGLVLAACQHYGANDRVADASGVPDKPDYNWDVRPILSQNCFGCHGAGTQKAGLRLDQSDTAFAKLPENPKKRAIVPGNPKRSELIKRISSDDPDFRMPPKEAHKTLSPTEIATLERWIKQGAKYKQHWAYIAPKDVRPARSDWDKQAAGQIDRYVYSRLERVGLAPSKEADRETLINRVTLDLTGLPPTLAEVDAFVNDKAPNAYEKVVDRLLSSTAYAERMAGIWMDVARYADTNGYLNDGDTGFQHPYRDWVIDAYKRNLPYDKFVTWQLAGDLLPNRTREQLLATYFARAGKKNNEGGIIDEEFRVEYVNERAELVGKAFLGLTVGCARCHDHKYDVISQADYYRMGGFFNAMDERGIHSGGARGTPMGPTLAAPTPKQTADIAAAHKVVVEKEAAWRAAVEQAKRDAAAKVQAASAPDQLGAFLQTAQAEDTQSYLPFEKTYRASFASLMIGPAKPAARPAGPARPAPRPGVIKANLPAAPGAAAAPKGPPGAKGPPGKARRPGADGGGDDEGGAFGGPPEEQDPDKVRVATDDLTKAVGKATREGRYKFINPIAIQKEMLRVGLDDKQLVWTADPRPGAKPGAINNVKLIDGPPGKGKAALLNDSIGFADMSIGQFDRFDRYTLDVWVKLRTGKPYEEVSLLQNASGKMGSGYELDLQDNTLRFTLTHNFPFNMIEVKALKPMPQGQWKHVAVTYDGSSKAAGVKLYVDGAPIPVQVLHDNLTRAAKARGGDSLYSSYQGFSFGKRFGAVEFVDGALDEVRVFTRALTPLEIAQLHNPAAARAMKPEAVKAGVADILAAKDPRVVKAYADYTAARLEEQKIETGVRQLMVMGDAPVPRKTYILLRGNYDQHGDEVRAQALERVFPWSDKLPRNRLGLTEWLFDPKNPMTARVYVNRLWQSHFGTGIVDTVEDFGTQGSNPTNPELLDWLAIEFQRSGWDVRHVQKLMVMSATYRQSSNISPVQLEKDPKNTWLARGPRYRLPAETIRDNALAASGLLVAEKGGDAVFPYQPKDVWTGQGLGANIYPDEVPNDQQHRRAMYTFIKRNAQFPSLIVFDMADRNVSSVARKISNTPLQALVLLNDPQYVEAYRKLSERAIKASPDRDRQIVDMFRLATRRRPAAKELAILKSYRAAEEARLAKDGKAVDGLLAMGVAPIDAGLDRVQLAAMTMTTAAVMNTPDAYTLR
jgi:hypothetical protein